MKIILFGGSFDPIHLAHINIAKKALKCLNADKVIFILNNKSKDKFVTTNISNREDMLNIAIKDIKEFSYSNFETTNTDISYTIDTVKEFKKIYQNDELFLLIGSDQYDNFHNWKNYQAILDSLKVVCYKRSNNLKKQTFENQVTFIDGEIIDISSTDIKENNLWDLIDINVNDYINENALYYTYRYKLFNLSDNRILHSLRMARMAYILMQNNNPQQAHLAWTAGVYHDVCKEYEQYDLEDIAYNQNNLKKAISWKVLHGPVGAIELKNKLHFKNELILNAIARHTQPLEVSNEEELTLLDKIIFCCDKLEPFRTEKDIANIAYLRELSKEDINKCFSELNIELAKQYGMK